MKRNILLILAIFIAVILGINSAKKIMSFRGTAQSVEEAKQKLERLRGEHEALKRELEYKKSERFVEEEIRNKLGLVREGETVVIVPKEDAEGQATNDKSNDKANWEKWKELFFGT